MYVNRAVELTQENRHRFQCFIVFEPSSSRVSEADILIRGEDVRNRFENAIMKLQERTSLRDLTLLNRLQKISQMLDLLVEYDNIIITKFFDRIWRRYSAISNIGELYLDLPTFIDVFPEFDKKQKDLLAQRIDDDDDDDGDSDDDDDDDNDDKSNESDSSKEDK